MVLVDMMRSPYEWDRPFYWIGPEQCGLDERKSRVFVKQVAKVEKERWLVGEKVAAAIERAMM